MTTRTLVILGLLFAGLGGFVSYHLVAPDTPTVTETGTAEKKAPAVPVGSQRPSFRLPDLDGEIQDVSQWDGKILILNFWATWCPPCRDEIPEFVHLQEKYATDDLQFVGIAPETANTVREFAADFTINYPLLVGQTDVIAIAEAYGNTIGALPYTVIVDRAGRIVHMQRGPLPTAKAEAIIKPLIAQSR